MTPRLGFQIEPEDGQTGRCCLNCLYYRQQDGNYCGYAMDDYGEEVWEEIRRPADAHRCIYWEEQ